jgi:predicted nucleotidyltransferase
VSGETSLLEQFAEVLFRHRVEFIVIGGQAENLMGSPRVTYDVDLCYRKTPENLQRLASALSELNVSLRGAPPDLPVRPDARTLGMGENFTFSTSLGDLDLLGYVEPIGGYESLLPRVEIIPLEDGNELRVISLDDLLRVKLHISRAKDSESIFQLQALKRAREEQQGKGDAPG